MKGKKLVIIIIAVVLGVCVVGGGIAAAVLLLGGCKEHDVSAWEVVTPATCSEEGLEKGICAECLKTVERSIPVNADAHKYGAWQVSIPTETTEGLATKTCEYNKSHTESAKLPVLSSTKYTSTILKRPSASGAGERQFTISNVAGDITFVAPIPTDIKSVLDAVEICASSESHELIRNAAGTIGYEYHVPEIEDFVDVETGVAGTRPAEDQVYSHDYEYEFGDYYTHIFKSDYDNTERWYGIEDGEVFGFARSNADGFISETGRGVPEAENYIDGFRFTLMYDSLGAYYGAENLLAGLYKTARLSTNDDFEESIETNSDGEVVYKFKFGYYTGNEEEGRFGNVTVDFTITKEYTLKDVNIQSILYVNNKGMDISANGKFNTWEIVDGIAKVKPGQEKGPRYIDKITISQTTKSEDPEVPTNPYTKEGTVYDSFDIKYVPSGTSGKTLNEQGMVEGSDGSFAPINRNASATISFKIDNVQPQSAATLGVDEFRVYYRNSEGADIPISFDSLNDIGLNANISGGNITVRSHIAGAVLLVVKSAKVEKLISLDINKIAPSDIYPTVYRYDPSGYSADKVATTECNATVYVGQTLYFRAEPPALEVGYADPSAKTSVTSGNISATTVLDGVDHGLLPFTVKDDVFISSFKASEPGNYVVTMETTKLATGQTVGKKCNINVTVLPAPGIETILTSEYAANLEYPTKGKVTVSFSSSGEDILAEIYVGGDVVAVLKCIYDERTKTLTTETVSGGDIDADGVRNYSLSLNEAYDIVISHPMGSDYPGMYESAILWRDIDSVLSGAYIVTVNSPSTYEVSVLFSEGEDDTFIATIICNSVTVKLSCVYDRTTKSLSTTVTSGDEVEPYNFSLYFNESFELILSHSVGGTVETVVLIR